MLTITPFINIKGLVQPIKSERATNWGDFYCILLANYIMAVLNIPVSTSSIIIIACLIHFIL